MLNVTFSMSLSNDFNQSMNAEKGMYEQNIYRQTVREAVQFLSDWYDDVIADITMAHGRALVKFKDDTTMTISA